MTQFVKILVGIVVALVAVAGGMSALGGDSAKQAPQAIKRAAPSIADELTITASTQQSVADALLQYAQEHNIEVKYKDYGGDMGLFIESIGGVPAPDNKDSGKWWQFWVNGEYSNKGASSVMLNSGDVVKWRYTSAQQ